MHNANDAKTFLKHFSDCLFYFCSTCAHCLSEKIVAENAWMKIETAAIMMISTVTYRVVGLSVQYTRLVVSLSSHIISVVTWHSNLPAGIVIAHQRHRDETVGIEGGSKYVARGHCRPPKYDWSFWPRQLTCLCNVLAWVVIRLRVYLPLVLQQFIYNVILTRGWAAGHSMEYITHAGHSIAFLHFVTFNLWPFDLILTP